MECSRCSTIIAGGLAPRRGRKPVTRSARALKKDEKRNSEKTIDKRKWVSFFSGRRRADENLISIPVPPSIPIISPDDGHAEMHQNLHS